MSQQHSWYYLADDFLGNSELVGPLPEAEFVALVKGGKVGLSTKINSPTRTNGAWQEVREITALVGIMQQAEVERRRAKEMAAQDRQKQKREAAEARQAGAAQEQARVAQFAHCQDYALVRTIEERVRPILTSQESIQYIAVQERPVMNIAPDAIVVTERRLIFYRPKLLGRFDFQDFLWFDLHNAHFKQGMLGATFWAQHVSGQVISMEYIPQRAAQELYRIAQEREEQSRIRRHNLQLETMRAGAANVNVHTNATTASQAHPPPATPNPSDDLVRRLESLKTMLDRGLITQDDFERRKQQILAQV